MPKSITVEALKSSVRKEATYFLNKPNVNSIGVALPQPASRSVKADLAVVNGRAVVDYTHFSLAMSKSRRFVRWVAWNIDGGSIKRISHTGSLIPGKLDHLRIRGINPAGPGIWAGVISQRAS